MQRKRPVGEFRASFERLERRDLMAADLSAYSSAAFLASNLGLIPADVDVHSVDGARITASSLRASAAKPAAAVAPPAAPKPVVAPPQPGANAVVSAWCNVNITDTALRAVVYQDGRDNFINRADMLDIFGQVKKDGTVSAAELADLKRLVDRNTFFVGCEFVDVLATDVIVGNAANARYQGQALGNLQAGSSAAHLDKLVRKWFYGDDHPEVMAGLTYRQTTGALFPHAPVYADVQQGLLGDCYYLASLGEAAKVNAALVTSMFIVNGDGSYTVRFYNKGKADYVTVDSMLPVDRFGNFAYANFGQNIANRNVPLWVALAEKAYAQMNESGWLRTDPGDKGRNSYAALNGGYMFEALAQITAKKGLYSMVDTKKFEAAYNSGSLITFGSYDRPVDASVVGGHAYAVVGYDKKKGAVTLFNPWGVNNGYAPGLVTLNWTQMKRDFFAMQYTA